MKTTISPNFTYPSHFETVSGAKMHYVKEGVGDPILFLHGIPTSSYVWRNIIPHLSSLGCCIAPDLIGLGKSDKPNISYSIRDHINYIEQFIDALQLKNLTLIMHGWGSIIGCDYAMRNEGNCKALVFYEAYLRAETDEDRSLALNEQIHTIDQIENIYDLVMNGSYYLDKFFPQEFMRSLSQKEMEHYRSPFLQEGAGKVLKQYLKELPRPNTRTEVAEIINNYSKKLTRCILPKLLLYSVPGYVTTIATAMWAKENFPNLEIADIGEELHFAQESNPDTMGETISVWLQGLEQNTNVTNFMNQ